MIVGILVLLFIVGASAGYSSLFLKRENYNNLTDYAIFSIVLGMGIIGGLTLLSAILKYINFFFFIMVVILGNIFLYKNRSSFKLNKTWKGTGILLIVIGVFLFVNLFYSMFPPTFYDSMMYHLAVPNYYILNGGITSWDTNFNASLPLNGEMLFLFSLLSGTVFTPKLISLFSGVLIILVITSWYRNEFHSKRKFLPALMFITIPQISFLMSSSKTDIIGMLYLILAVRSFFYYLNRGKDNKFLLLSGVFWGLAVGTKYIFAFYLTGFLLSLILFMGGGFKKRLRTVIKMSVIVLLCLSPWFGKNIVLKGNPFYPYMNKYFGNNNWDFSQQKTFSSIIKRGNVKSMRDYLSFPLKVLTKPYSYGITAVWGFVFTVFLPFSLFHGDGRRGRILFFASISGFILMIPFAMVPRYFLASLLFISFPISMGVERAIDKFNYFLKPFLALITAVSFFNLILLVQLQENFFHGISFLIKKYSGEYGGGRMKYLYALPYYGGVEYINDHLSDNDKVLFLGEDRTFYMKKMFMASSFNDRNVLVEILKKSLDFSDFKNDLKALGITHIFYFPFGLKRMGKSSALYHLTRKSLNKMENYFLNFSVLYKDRNYILYKIGE